LKLCIERHVLAMFEAPESAFGAPESGVSRTAPPKL
jgi:hypothetical protein